MVRHDIPGPTNNVRGGSSDLDLHTLYHRLHITRTQKWYRCVVRHWIDVADLRLLL